MTSIQPKIRLPLPDLPAQCGSCGATPDEWPLGVYGHVLNVTCPNCFSIVAPVVATLDAAEREAGQR